MTTQLDALCFGANDPLPQARFWAGVLGRELVEDPHAGISLRPNEDTEFVIRFSRSAEPKVSPNHIHFDLTSESLDHQVRTVATALDLGGKHIDIGQRPEEGHVVLADPEGNEFCVLGPANAFLDGCGLLGALSCDGSQAVGYFWSEALGWPLVWDQDQETAIQSPRGGAKIAWGGPPVLPSTGRARLHLDLAPDGDLETEVDRLVALGATRIGAAGHGDDGGVELTDPDGREFCVLADAGA